MKRLALYFIYFIVFMSLIVSCWQDVRAQDGVESPTPQPTIVATATADNPPVLGMPVDPNRCQYDQAWDYGRPVDARQTANGPVVDILLYAGTKEMGPPDADLCFKTRRGNYAFVKEAVPITQEAYERLTGNYREQTIAQGPASLGVEVSAGWEGAYFAVSFDPAEIASLPAEQVSIQVPVVTPPRSGSLSPLFLGIGACILFAILFVGMAKRA